MKGPDIRNLIIEKGMKVTPQRMVILEAIFTLNNHPAADQILEHIRKKNPNVSLGTVYKVLDAFVEKGLVKTVKTDKDVKRYDAEMEHHHHIYISDSDRIVDFEDDELDQVLREYFEKKPIPDFSIGDIKLQIVGTLKKKSGK